MLAPNTTKTRSRLLWPPLGRGRQMSEECYQRRTEGLRQSKPGDSNDPFTILLKPRQGVRRGGQLPAPALRAESSAPSECRPDNIWRRESTHPGAMLSSSPEALRMPGPVGKAVPGGRPVITMTTSPRPLKAKKDLQTRPLQRDCACSLQGSPGWSLCIQLLSVLEAPQKCTQCARSRAARRRQVLGAGAAGQHCRSPAG